MICTKDPKAQAKFDEKLTRLLERREQEAKARAKALAGSRNTIQDGNGENR